MPGLALAAHELAYLVYPQTRGERPAGLRKEASIPNSSE